MFGKTKRNLSPEETRFFYFSIFAIALLVSLMQAESTLARTWYIKADGTGDAPTIQAGVDSAAAGDTVLVGGGTYSDTTHVKIYSSPVPVNVHLNKNIVLAGETPGPDVIINGVLSATAIFVHDVDSTAVIRSMKIRRADPTIYCILDMGSDVFRVPLQHEDAGILCRNASPRIEENKLVDLGYGVKIEGGATFVHRNSFLRTFAGVSLTNSTTATISNNVFDTFWVAIGGSGCTPRITDNIIQGNQNSCTGINLYDAFPYISSNVLRDVEYDIITLHTSRATIEHNSIEAGAWSGVSLMQCDLSVVRYNTFRSNSLALAIQASSQVTVENNTFDGVGTDGIVIDQFSDPVIRRNIISRILYAVECIVGASPTFECNDIFGATRSYLGCPDQTGLNGNIAVDPEFCGIDESGNYFLQSDSPCAPGNHPNGYNCGLVGAYEVNCGKVDAAQRSWGGIKSLYR